MRAQMTRRTRNDLTPSGMHPRRITQQSKGLRRRVSGAEIVDVRETAPLPTPDQAITGDGDPVPAEEAPDDDF